MVKNALLFICAAIMLGGCHSSQKEMGPPICEQLDSILSDCIKEDGHYMPVFRLIFYDVDGINFLDIHPAYYYTKPLADGYFIYKKKLITYEYWTNVKDHRIIYEENTLPIQDSIEGFTEYQNRRRGDQIDYFGTPRQFVIQPNGELQEYNEKMAAKSPHIASDMDIIKNPQLNKALNNYINNARAILYNFYIGAFNKKQEHYVALWPCGWYDKDFVKAYFYRNGNLIVVYADDDINLSEYLDLGKVTIFRDTIPNRKNGPIELFAYPFSHFYIIKSETEIEDCVDSTPEDTPGGFRFPKTRPEEDL